MIARPWLWGLAIGLSAGVHVAIAAMVFDAPQQPTDDAGGDRVAVSIAGESLADLLAAGAIRPRAPARNDVVEPLEQTSELLEPLPNGAAVSPATSLVDPVTPVRTENALTSTEPATQRPVVAPQELAAQGAVGEALGALPVQASSPDRVTAVEPEGAETAVAPVTADVLEPVKPTETIAASEPASMSASLPVPQPRPANLVPPRAQRAEASRPRPAAARQQPARQKASAPAGRLATQQARAKPRGDGGQARQTTRRSSGQQTANAAATTRAGQRAVANYPGRVARKLRRALQYPREARRAGVTGQAQVRFTVRANGQATSVRIVRGSGSPVLDRAAAQAVQRASPFAPIPREAGRSSWTFTVPLAFER